MNCRRCEHLMPLYVEGDLTSRLADQMSEHLDWCGKCNWLFDEYKESQSWLRSPSASEFGDAELSALKAGILKRVTESSAKPSLLGSLMQQWGRRQVFAVSTAVVIAGAVLLYVYQTRAKVTVPVPQIVDSHPSQQPIQPDPPALAAAPDKPSDASPSKRHRQPKRRYVRASNSEPALARQVVERNGSQAGPGEQNAPGQAVNRWADLMSSPAVLRIEFQTSDPNIRIIWFAPKETGSHQTKPATD
jgi:hypothetical protein